MSDRLITGEFTADDWQLIAEALDSHLYWQLAPAERRRDGYVIEPMTEQEREVQTLEEQVNALIRSAR